MAAPTELHKTLARQLRRAGIPPEQAAESRLESLLGMVSNSYADADADRYTLERSIEIASGEMRALHEVLSHRARHDSLTGLLNRAALAELLGDTLAGQPAGTCSAVLFIDLDGFKLVNDSLGHAAGDELLVRAAERIRAAVRDGDIVARQGGDEFVVLCVNIGDMETAWLVAGRIAAQLRAPFRIGSQDTAVSASIGISLAAGGTAGPDDLLRQADIAMYEAKLAGRSRVMAYDEQLQRTAEGRLTTEQALRHALDRRELVLHYQPITDLVDHRLLGMEALVRWQRPGIGMVPPDDFIPVAEQSRLITSIDAWVVQEACRQAAGWPSQVSVSVNLSARDLRHDDVVATISASLHASGLSPRRLAVELTETAIMSDDEAIGANLRRLQEIGVQVAIDDFGTGYSSLAYLRQLPADVLKMDRAFVSSVDEDAASAAIVGAIVTVGHALDLRIVAEGVERSAQASRLRELGCDAAQGFYFARPLPPEELSPFLAEGWLDEAGTPTRSPAEPVASR